MNVTGVPGVTGVPSTEHIIDNRHMCISEFHPKKIASN